MAKPDPNRVLRLMPIAVGAIGSILLLINRIYTPALTDSQARSDAAGVILSAFLILTGLLWQQIQPRSPESVTLIGEEGFEVAPDLPEPVKAELAWASHILLTNTVTKSIVIWYDNQILLRRGVLSPNAEVKPGAILQRVLSQKKPVYLVALNLYPGRIEFDYMPENTQGLICQPIDGGGAMILGANAPRSYTRQDEAWIAAIAQKLDYTLSQFRPTAKKES